jgi:FkbM family methyltransferase
VKRTSKPPRTPRRTGLPANEQAVAVARSQRDIGDPLPPGGNLRSGKSQTVTEILPLSRAKGQWLVGDWQSLVALDAETIATHPERDRLALLVACAHQQRAEHDRAREYTRKALAWGCDSRLVARLLISGLHNTLGRIAALKADDDLLEHHFTQALALTGDADSSTATHTRAIREMAQMGLLPQAARLLQGEFDDLGMSADRPVVQAARIEMLRSEVELLQHELSLAHQRNQVGVGVRIDAPEASLAGHTTLEQLQRRSPSQLGQDLWVLQRTGYKRSGFFVEFGATDGVRLSNTYLLETEFGWQGICAEPNPRMFAKLQKNRRCVVSETCIGATTGEVVEFVLAEEFGGMVKDMSNDMHAAKREAYFTSAAHRTTFQTVSLHDMLVRLNAPREIDYISVDTEGSEYEILRAFPFDLWHVRCFTVEHNYTSTRADLLRLFQSHGYRRTESQWDDWYELVLPGPATS